MTRIARYIDDPPQFFFWEIDEVVVFSTCFAIGIMSGLLTIMIVMGIGAGFLLSRVKQGRSDGFFLHVLYWRTGMGLKGCPSSHIRSYVE